MLLLDISLQEGNIASCIIMGDSGQANVRCRFVDENDLSHLNIRRFILKLDRTFSGLDETFLYQCKCYLQYSLLPCRQ